jgi:hypothetical protein
MNNGELRFLKDIGDSIKFTLKNGHISASLILTYSAIDCMASLIMPEEQKEVTGSDFKKWVDIYMKTDPVQSYQYRGVDLWGARCGLVHRYSPYSNVIEREGCKVFQYHDGGNHIYNPSINESVVMISAPRLINDFYEGMRAFLKNLIEDDKLREKAGRRIGNLFRVLPYAE